VGFLLTLEGLEWCCMTSFISSLAEVGMYTLAWFVLSCGFTFVVAAAFFGFPEEEKNLKEK
jgi:hypothetical protein